MGTDRLPNNTYIYQSSYSYFLLLLLQFGCGNNHNSIPFVYLVQVWVISFLFWGGEG